MTTLLPPRPGSVLPVDLGDGLRLELRSLEGAPAVLDLTLRNLDRLREWEHWAQPLQTLESTLAFTELVLRQHAAGRLVLALVADAEGPIASVSLRIDRPSGSAELGYWIDAAHEGRGIVTRAASVLVDHATELGLTRLDIRAAVANHRSRAVAERLGFTLDRIVPGGLPVGERRLDLAVYALTLPALTPPGPA